MVCGKTGHGARSGAVGAGYVMQTREQGAGALAVRNGCRIKHLFVKPLVAGDVHAMCRQVPEGSAVCPSFDSGARRRAGWTEWNSMWRAAREIRVLGRGQRTAARRIDTRPRLLLGWALTAAST
eukprot:2751609-Prymnesium_polylepis.1